MTIKEGIVTSEDVVDIRPSMKWFQIGERKSHIVNESVGEQGRPGQVVAWCGFGTVMPVWLDEPANVCKTCVKRVMP